MEKIPINNIINLKSHTTGEKMKLSRLWRARIGSGQSDFSDVMANKLSSFPCPLGFGWHGGKKHSGYPMAEFRYSSHCTQKANDKYIEGKYYSKR